MFSTTTGVNPAATIALKQDFWSIRVQTMVLAPGLAVLNAANVRAKDILPTPRKKRTKNKIK